MRLYFAAPLFCQSERAFNAELAAKIEALGYRVFLPQDNSKEIGFSWEEAEPEAWSRAIFELDRDALLAADVVVFILDGRAPDEGMCVELGLAYARRMDTGRPRHLIGYWTDFRVFSPAGLNAMVSGALDEIHRDEPALLRRLASISKAGD